MSQTIARHLLAAVSPLLPRLGDTERVALEAGTVGWEGELFSGHPNWSRLLAHDPTPLSIAEQAFLDGPVERVCAMLDDWEIARAGDLPDEIWQLLRRERFFGMIIPEKYGGRGFSARAHSAVVMKLASRSVTAAVTVMVPNSLGPAELLLHYGTDAQRDYYLPRLAHGEEMPCFALTEPGAGSDASAAQSEGVVCRDKWDGAEVLGVRLSWRKRYITLAPVATLIGLAFQLRDPDHLLGERDDWGITCALVPAHLPGIEIGERHDPIGVPFQNGPTSGDGVFVPLDAIIGGRDGAGAGWKMLMESLATGRSISLPSVACAGAQLAARTASAYSVVREQFGLPIGRFEGVQERLARIAGLTYAIDAARALTLAAVDRGERPAVASAIAKTYCTEAMRVVVNDAMDVLAGAAIMRGPRNALSALYATIPIGITVEGANILTRSMIIFGQGAIRCHPFAFAEIEAAEANDAPRFARAFVRHIGHVFANAARALVGGLTSGALVRAPRGPLRRVCQRLARASAAFALVSDAAMATLGGELKRREAITGRLADALAWLYIGSAVVKRAHDERDGDGAIARWAADHALACIDRALAGTLRNLPARPVAWLLSALVFPLGVRERGPDDACGARAAQALLEDERARDALTRGIYLPPADEIGLGQLDTARRIVRSVGPGEPSELERRAVERARDAVIRVDAFDADEYAQLRR